mmetsp:Transcript_89837/g.277814  ORF Transcript_89837/g.277814 Transcript_89837/m.277814 type:complete len:307 (-) Transcript_89837:2-922(-)
MAVLREMASGRMPSWRKPCTARSARLQCPGLASAPSAALRLTMLGRRWPFAIISRSTWSAPAQPASLPCAVRTALWLTTSGRSASSAIRRRTLDAASERPPFSQALTTALHAIMLASTSAACISASCANALTHCIPFSQALITALHVITSRTKPLIVAVRNTPTASSHRATLPNELSKALWATRSGSKPPAARHAIDSNANHHLPCFSQALTAVLQLTTSCCSEQSTMPRRSHRTHTHWCPALQAANTALCEMRSGPVRRVQDRRKVQLASSQRQARPYPAMAAVKGAPLSTLAIEREPCTMQLGG